MNDYAAQEQVGCAPRPDYQGDTPAPETGRYEQLNVFGRATGHQVTVEHGIPLPPLPRGFSWRLARNRG